MRVSMCSFFSFINNVFIIFLRFLWSYECLHFTFMSQFLKLIGDGGVSIHLFVCSKAPSDVFAILLVWQNKKRYSFVISTCRWLQLMLMNHSATPHAILFALFSTRKQGECIKWKKKKAFQTILFSVLLHIRRLLYASSTVSVNDE